MRTFGYVLVGRMLSLLPILVVWSATDPTTPKLNLHWQTSFVVFAGDANAHPPMAFGGKLLSEMDRTAGITVRRLLFASPVRDAVTVGLANVRFHNAARVKDLLHVRGEVTGIGVKSITVRVSVHREIMSEEFGEVETLLVDGVFTFVAYDVQTQKAVPHGLPER